MGGELRAGIGGAPSAGIFPGYGELGLDQHELGYQKPALSAENGNPIGS